MSILNVKKYYTDQEWQQREQYYIQAINQIRIPQAPGPAEIKYIQAAVSNLMDEVLLDLQYVRETVEFYKTKLELLESELYLYFKNPPISGSAAPPKRTESEVKALIQTTIADATSPNQHIQNLQLGNITMFQIRDIYTARENFMKNLMKMLDNKNQALMIDTGVLKLEFNLDGNRNVR